MSAASIMAFLTHYVTELTEVPFKAGRMKGGKSELCVMAYKATILHLLFGSILHFILFATNIANTSYSGWVTFFINYQTGCWNSLAVFPKFVTCVGLTPLLCFRARRKPHDSQRHNSRHGRFDKQFGRKYCACYLRFCAFAAKYRKNV